MASPQSSSHNPFILSSLPLTSQFSIFNFQFSVLTCLYRKKMAKRMATTKE